MTDYTQFNLQFTPSHILSSLLRHGSVATQSEAEAGVNVTKPMDRDSFVRDFDAKLIEQKKKAAVQRSIEKINEVMQDMIYNSLTNAKIRVELKDLTFNEWCLDVMTPFRDAGWPGNMWLSDYGYDNEFPLESFTLNITR